MSSVQGGMLNNDCDIEFDMKLGACGEKYLNYIKKTALREGSLVNYRGSINTITRIMGENTLLENISKDHLIKFREIRISEGVGAVRLKEDIRILRQMLKWCYEEGHLSFYSKESLDIPIPTSRTVNTAMIPKEAADKAMLIWSAFNLVPRIARYTGMRKQEILSMTEKSISTIHGIKCITVGEMSKTHRPRIIPIAEKLLPHLNFKSKEFNVKTTMVDKYNLLIKAIPGCEKCSFHSWRVYANTCMMEEGVDQAVRMKILGHIASKLEVHIGYTQVALNQMKKAVDLIP